MSDSPWYRDGLRFECLGCGRCCTGEPGYVWVNQQEILVLAQAVGLTADEFQRQFVRSVGKRKSLIEKPNGDCIFFDSLTRRCTVYDSRPNQCRTWPFWDSNLRTPKAWEEVCRACPGSGRGPLVGYQVIVEKLGGKTG